MKLEINLDMGMEGLGHVPRPRKFTIANIIRIGMFPCDPQTCGSHPPEWPTRGFKSLQARDKQKLDQKGRACAWLGWRDLVTIKFLRNFSRPRLSRWLAIRLPALRTADLQFSPPNALHSGPQVPTSTTMKNDPPKR